MVDVLPNALAVLPVCVLDLDSDTDDVIVRRMLTGVDATLASRTAPPAARSKPLARAPNRMWASS
jgi:hypothetical protein